MHYSIFEAISILRKSIKTNVYLCPGLYGLPRRHGKLKELGKFDYDFFGIDLLSANYMDPQVRILLEVVYEALVDAGWFRFVLNLFRNGVICDDLSYVICEQYRVSRASVPISFVHNYCNSQQTSPKRFFAAETCNV